MERFRREIFLSLLMVFFAGSKLSRAQELIQISVHPAESFYVHSAENVALFSDVKNSGSIAAYQNSVITFFGQRWTNMAGSRIIDETPTGTSGKGGYFKFRSLTNSTQYIDNKNAQANIFPNITIANSGNVILEGSDLALRGNLNFDSGRLILNNRNAVLSANATITGYDNYKFIVTGTGVTGGFLVRNSSGLQQPDLIFPIGTTVSSYTPASLNYKGVAQNIKVRVFDNVYDKAVFGTPDNVNVVPKTWNMSLSQTDPSSVITFNAQHSANEEVPAFTAKRAESYLARYSGKLSLWDKIAPSALGPGSLTSGNVITNAYKHTRPAISSLASEEYFAKAITNVTSTLAGLRIPAGISPNNDGLNDKFVIENLNPADRVRLDIYNRWQTLVFSDGNYKNTFDGTGNQKGLVNNELPNGTYYYILNINTEKPVTGYIIINR